MLLFVLCFFGGSSTGLDSPPVIISFYSWCCCTVLFLFPFQNNKFIKCEIALARMKCVRIMRGSLVSNGKWGVCIYLFLYCFVGVLH